MRTDKRIWMAFAALLTTAGIAGCGGSSATHFADNPRPPATVDLSVYVDDGHVSVSPDRLGAGPVIMYVTNQASGPVSLHLTGTGGSTLASTGAINSGQTAELSTSLSRGSYQLTAGTHPQPAGLRIGAMRASADNELLAP